MHRCSPIQDPGSDSMLPLPIELESAEVEADTLHLCAHHQVMPPPQQVLRHVSGSPLGVARPSSSEGLRPLVYSARGPPNPCPFLPNRIGGVLLSWIRLNCAGCGIDIPWGNGNPFFLLCPQPLQLSSLLAAAVFKTLREIMF